ncbi:fimbria/pilus outer membrane usher protein [uncultured Acinetobacter sp.]|uniref:fimbria/pilus outer membrane usher protein n=1 Tax=uncultured Acinetobacter sp. TaxID=165433 RepID=UPI0026124F2E|nr:fimbria/pilus outer membrane usher protein [uncultured Acinetobacter sp.]
MKTKNRYVLLFLISLSSQITLAEGPIRSADQNQIEEQKILSLFVNGVNQHIDAFVIRKNQNLYIECQHLAANNVIVQNAEKNYADGRDYCLLDSQGMSYEIIEDQQVLNLKIAADRFPSNPTQNLKNRQYDLPSLGGFLNYSTYYQNTEHGDHFQTLAHLNLFWKNILFENSYLFGKQQHDFEHQRLNTSLSFDFPEKMSALKIGDTTSNYYKLTQPFYFAGISFGTHFTSYPNYTYWNTPSISGSALTQSSVDLIINGTQAYQAQINPGQYNLESNIGFSGLGEGQIIVTDILGNSTVQEIPIFIHQRLLKPKLNDYNISIGQLRYNYSTQEDDYRDWFGRLYFRRGLSPSTTLGTVLDYSEQLQSAGLLWSQYLYKVGLLEVNSAYSQVKDLDLKGYTVNSELSHHQQHYSFGMRHQYYSPEFRMLGLDDYRSSFLPEYESQFYLSKNNIPYLKNISLNYVEREYATNDQRDQKIFNLRNSQAFNKKLFGSFGLSYDVNSHKPWGFDLFLTYNFDDPKKTLSFSQNNENQSSLIFNQYAQKNTGLEYNIGLSKLNDDYSGHVSTRFKTNVGDLDLRYIHAHQAQQYSVSHTGSVVWLDNRLTLSKQIQDSFALIRVKDIKDLDILSNGISIGQTNHQGEIFSYHIYANTENHIYFDPNQLDIDTHINHSTYQFLPMHQRGYVIDFPVSDPQNMTNQDR